MRTGATILSPTVCEVKSDRILIVALAVLSIFAFDSRATTSTERSVSPSGQFIIYGGDAAWRGAVSALAERTKTNLLAVLQRRDQWTTAAVINLQPRAANLPEIPTATLRFSQTGSGLKLQLDLTISREMDPVAMEREILRVILLEMIYRNQTAIPSGEAYVEAPDWLIEGLLALTPNSDCLLLVNAALTVARGLPVTSRISHSLQMTRSQICRPLFHNLPETILEKFGNRRSRA